MTVKKNIKLILIPAIYLVSVFLLFVIFRIFWQINFISAQSSDNSADAIAIRVIPNPKHFSALRWYNERKFQGSPQSLTVDGYEAVRDGRTVYVNVANVNGDYLYTNIYLISYNQQAENFTADIFSNILAHWTFNTNLPENGHCRQGDNRLCSSDFDCSLEDFCDSMKARVIRDTRRLGDLAEIKIMLDSYHNQGFYPKLSSGTYLPNKTLSVWPSWRETLADDLGQTLPVDPVNALGDCPSEYNKITCWNEQTKQFVNSDWPNLPQNSLVYTYYSDTNGNFSNICATFESGLDIIDPYINISACPDICVDNDKDGYGLNYATTCTHPEADCNDSDSTVHNSIVPEVGSNCHDGIDNDCDNRVDCGDSDCELDLYCTTIPPFCGDTICNNGETNATCPGDCPLACAGNGCNGNCPAGCTQPSQDPDCGGVGCCGDNNCDLMIESNLTCPGDCPTAACTDDDGDRYIEENIDPATCGSVCGLSHNQTCSGNNDCEDDDFAINSLADEWCDGIDNDCVGGVDDGWTAETCPYLCLPYIYVGSRCCGNDINEGGPYENPEANCIDGRDNDCDTYIDIADSNCSGVCSNMTESDHVGTTPGCNQCSNINGDNLNIDNDSDQIFPPATEADWGTNANKIDACDPDCGPGLDLIDLNHFEPTETSCNDTLDNDCDGQRNCDDDDCDLAANCLLTCSDNITPYNTCVTSGAPRYCNSSGILIDNCQTCGCTGSWVCGPLNTFCCDNQCNSHCSPTGCDAAHDPDCGGTGCCGDTLCNNGETNATCPGDCPLTCTPTCSTGPGCLASLTNGQVTSGICCGGTSCFECQTGYTWNGSACVLGCTPTCATGPGCLTSLTNGQVTSGICCGGTSCFECQTGYTWNGSACVSSGCTFPFIFPCTFP